MKIIKEAIFQLARFNKEGFTGYLESAFTPCTPAGCLTLIESTGKELAGCNAVVIGRVEIYGDWEDGENLGESNAMAEGTLL